MFINTILPFVYPPWILLGGKREVKFSLFFTSIKMSIFNFVGLNFVTSKRTLCSLNWYITIALLTYQIAPYMGLVAIFCPTETHLILLSRTASILNCGVAVINPTAFSFSPMAYLYCCSRHMESSLYCGPPCFNQSMMCHSTSHPNIHIQYVL